MTKDLTKGTPWKVIAKFSLPVIGGNLFQLFYTLADTVIVGRTLGAEALAAVGATATIVYFVLCFIQGLTGGFGILLGQAFGAGNERQMKESVGASYWICTIFSVFSTILCCCLVDGILRMMNTPGDIYERAYRYLFIIFIGNGAAVFYNMISNMLRALGDSKTPLYFLVFSSLLNVVLDIVFIVPCNMDVAGAAWATVLSQAVSAALCIWYAGKKFEVMRLNRQERRFQPDAVKRHLKIGFPMGFQMSVMCIGQLAMQAAVNRIGTEAIAGYTAAKADQLAVLVDNSASQDMWRRISAQERSKRSMALFFNADFVKLWNGSASFGRAGICGSDVCSGADGSDYGVCQRLFVCDRAVLSVFGGAHGIPDSHSERREYMGSLCSLRDRAGSPGTVRPGGI